MGMVACPSAKPSGRAKMAAAAIPMERLACADVIRRDVVGDTVEKDTWMDDGRRKLCIPLLVISCIVFPNKTDNKTSLGKAVSSTPQEEVTSSTDDAFSDIVTSFVN
eukprot:15365812-Ditylum_brightwellii.AAC.1